MLTAEVHPQYEFIIREFVPEPFSREYCKPPSTRQSEPAEGSPDRVTISAEASSLTNGRMKSELELSSGEKEQLAELRRKDAKVRAHEQAHLSAAGGLAVGGARYEYAEGPDGNRYAVSGEVKLRIPDAPSPEQDLKTALQVEKSALAPVDPSSQDRATADQARKKARQAIQEMVQQNSADLKRANALDLLA